MLSATALMVMLLLDGEPVACDARLAVRWWPGEEPRTMEIRACLAQTIVCRPQQTVTYRPADRVIEIGPCEDLVIHRDRFE